MGINAMERGYVSALPEEAQVGEKWESEVSVDLSFMPKRSDYFFGEKTCAICLTDIRGAGLARIWMEAERGWDNEIMIPAGTQRVHYDCWRDCMRAESKPARKGKSK